MLADGYLRKGPLSKRQERISDFINPTLEELQKPVPRDTTLISSEQIDNFREWINNSLQGLSSDKLKLKLSSAYWTITDIEYLLIRFFGTVLAFLLGWWISGNFLGG